MYTDEMGALRRKNTLVAVLLIGYWVVLQVFIIYIFYYFYINILIFIKYYLLINLLSESGDPLPVHCPGF